MSGFEIAGVVLGSLPILLKSAVVVKAGLQDTIDWCRFNRKLEDFIGKLERERMAYRQFLKLLLDHTTIAQREFDILIDGSDPELWKEARATQAIESRFDDYEQNYIKGLLKHLCNAVHALQESLPEQRVPNADTHFLETELDRIKFSFSQNAPKLLDQVAETNDALHDFLKRDEVIRTRTTARKRMVSLKSYHQQALKFHKALADCWNCSCPTAHEVGIAMRLAADDQWESPGQNPLEVLFRDDQRKALLSLEAVQTQTEAKGHQSSSAPNAGSAAFSNEVEQIVTDYQEGAGKVRKLDGKGARISFRLREKISKVASSVGFRDRTGPGSSHLSDPTDLQAYATKRPRKPIKTPPLIDDQVSCVPTSTTRLDDETQTIDNVCEMITKLSIPAVTSQKQRQIFFDNNRKIPMCLNDGEQHMLGETTIRTLASIVKERNMTPSERLQTGLPLVATILSVATTPWLPNRLDQEDTTILLRHAGNAYNKTLGPYFSWCLTRDSAAEKHSWNARPCLLLLGIILLELFHGVRLDEQPTWKVALGDGGSPNMHTVFVSAFLWIEKSKDIFREHYSKELGGNLYAALNKCICFKFLHAGDPAKGDTKLAEEVFQEVYWPLKACFPRQSLVRGALTSDETS